MVLAVVLLAFASYLFDKAHGLECHRQRRQDDRSDFHCTSFHYLFVVPFGTTLL